MRRVSYGIAGLILIIGSLGIATSMSPASGADDAPPTFAYSMRDAKEAGCELVKIDLTTGAVTELSADTSLDACVRDLAVAPDGTPWGITSSHIDGDGDGGISTAFLVKFSPTTGAVDQRLEIGFDEADFYMLADGGIAFIGATAYIQVVTEPCGPQVCLYTVDTTTGVPTMIGGSGISNTDLSGLANCGGLVSLVYEAELFNLASVSQTNGAATIIGPDFGETIYIDGYDCSGTVGYVLAALYDPDTEIETLVLAPRDPATGSTTGTEIPVDTDIWLLALQPAQTVDTTTSTTSSTSTSTSTSTLAPTRFAANNVQPRFAG